MVNLRTLFARYTHGQNPNVRHFAIRVTRKPMSVVESKDNSRKPKSVVESKDSSFALTGEEPDEKFDGKISLEEAAKKLSSMLKAVDVRKYREKKHIIYLEGRRLIEEALNAGIHPKVIFHTKTENIAGLEFPKSTPVLRVHYRDLDLWSELATPQGVVGFFNQPAKLNFGKDRLPISVICDNIRDPSNLGAIVRSVAGAGCDSLLATKGCVDVWNSRTLRGGSGGHFKVPVVNDLSWSDMEGYVSSDTEVLVALNKTDCLEHDLPIVPYYEAGSASKVALIVGGETEGVSADALEFVKKRSGKVVHIPLRNNLESLSVPVATGVILFHLAQFFSKRI